jgi:uncharacterized protein
VRIDAHVHYTPPSLARELRARADEEPYWSLLLEPGPSGQVVQEWVEAERMLADMDRVCLDRVVIQGSYWQKHESCRARNAEVSDLLRRWPDRLSAFAIVQPKAGQCALDELERCLDGGMCGVGEVGPYGQGFSLEDPDFLRLAEACIEHDVPLNLHVSEEVGHFYPGKSTTRLLSYYHLACRYPELKLVLAHWGGGLFFYEIMPEVRRNLANVWYDTAASPLLFPTAAVFRSALGCLDHRKILYASDYPLRICPRKQQGADFEPFLAEIDDLHLDSRAYADIMGDNAARLLGFAPPDEPDLGEPTPARRGASTVVTEIGGGDRPVHGRMAVRAVAEMWPAARAVFDRYGMPWQEGAAPFWEPIAQAAAARGHGAEAQARLLADLNEATSDSMKRST